MADILTLETPRLWFRTWCDEDLDALAAISADPEVVRHFPAPLDRDETAAMLRRIRDHFAAHGFGLWALERKDDGRLIGFTGLGWTGFDAHFTPAVEIGWRLARDQWRQGFAREAALAALAAGFERLGFAEIVSFTALSNRRSQRVMQAIGMRRDPADDFDHPKLAEGHPLRRHLLYRLRLDEWQERHL